MGAYAVLQELITVEGDSSASAASATQGLDDWLDAGNWADGIFTISIHRLNTAGADTVDVSLRTSSRKSGAGLANDGGQTSEIWKQLNVASGGVYKRAVYLDASNPAPIERFCLWHVGVNGTAGAWSCTFDVTAVLKRPV